MTLDDGSVRLVRAGPAPAGESGVVRTALGVAGRTWTLSGSPTPAGTPALAWLVLGAGLLLSVAILVIVANLQHAERLAGTGPGPGRTT